MSAPDDFQVEAKTWLRRSTFRELYQRAEQRKITVGQLLSELADQSLQEPKKQRRAWRRMTPELMERFAELEARGVPYVRIAEHLGVSKGTLDNHRAKLRRTP